MKDKSLIERESYIFEEISKIFNRKKDSEKPIKDKFKDQELIITTDYKKKLSESKQNFKEKIKNLELKKEKEIAKCKTIHVEQVNIIEKEYSKNKANLTKEYERKVEDIKSTKQSSFEKNLKNVITCIENELEIKKQKQDKINETEKQRLINISKIEKQRQCIINETEKKRQISINEIEKMKDFKRSEDYSIYYKKILKKKILFVSLSCFILTCLFFLSFIKYSKEPTLIQLSFSYQYCIVSIIYFILSYRYYRILKNDQHVLQKREELEWIENRKRIENDNFKSQLNKDQVTYENHINKINDSYKNEMDIINSDFENILKTNRKSYKYFNSEISSSLFSFGSPIVAIIRIVQRNNEFIETVKNTNESILETLKESGQSGGIFDTLKKSTTSLSTSTLEKKLSVSVAAIKANTEILKNYYPEEHRIEETRYQTILAKTENDFKTSLKQLNFEQKKNRCEKNLLENIHKVDVDYESSLSEYRNDLHAKNRTIENTFQTKVDKLRSELQNNLVNIENTFQKSLTELQNKISALKLTISQRSISYKPGHLTINSKNTPLYIPIGTLSKTINNHTFEVPALIQFLSNKFIIFNAEDSGLSISAFSLQCILLKLMSNIPPGKLYFTFIDPVGLGKNVSPFLHLEDYDSKMIGSKVWTEQNHIEKCLIDLTEHMQIVIQKYLRNEFDNIEEYNKNAVEIAEPYRILVIMNFPVNFTEESAKRLTSILQSGPKCGVYTFLQYDNSKKLPREFTFNYSEDAMIEFKWNSVQEEFVYEYPGLRSCILKLEMPPKSSEFSSIIKQVGIDALKESKVQVPMEKILSITGLYDKNIWNSDSSEGIIAPIGMFGANKVLNLDLGKGTSQHAIIAGKTGSGKSTLLHVIITNLIIKYSPSELIIYMIDFKKGVEFKVYANYQIPHAKVIAIDSEREFGLSALKGLNDELTKRGDLFRGIGVDNIKDYKRKHRKIMPRILFLVDEFQEFFIEEDDIARTASQVLDRIVRQGRAFGIHVLLGSQTLAGTYTLSRSTIDQIAVRISLQCSEADSRLILSDDNPAARLLSRPGEAIYNASNGLVEGNNLFQVAWIDDENQSKYLNEIVKKSKKLKCWPPINQIVFEGNVPSNPETSSSLNEILINPQWQIHSKQEYFTWLGEPVAIKDASNAVFRRQNGSNLLMVGKNEINSSNTLFMNILTLSAYHSPKSAIFYILKYTLTNDQQVDYFSKLTEILPHTINYGKKRNTQEYISKIYEELENRLDNEGTKQETEIYLVIIGLQKARELKKEDPFSSSLDFDSTKTDLSVSSKYQKIIIDGPDFGIHTLIWCDTVTNLNRFLDRRVLPEFDLKIAFHMTKDDSLTFIDSTEAEKLPQHRALYFNEDEGRMEKFRPYGVPSNKWLEKIKNRFDELSKKL